MSQIDIENQPYCVVAVGSTHFDELIEALDKPHFYQSLEALGISGLLFQLGKGNEYRPQNFPDRLTVEVHSYVVLEPYLKNAKMVICHCGAGTLLESLRARGTPDIIAVVNSTLMDNHQLELADQLAQDGLVYKADSPDDVQAVINQVTERRRRNESLIKFPARTPGVVLSLIDELLL